MEDNIYDELDNYERLAEYDELKEENTRLQQCVRELNEKISQLTQDNSKLTERLNNIEKSFAALLNTAKAEIERKTEMIATLNMEKDQLIFRHIGNRNYTPNRWNFHRKPQNSNPNKRKLDPPPSEENKIPRLETQRDVRDTEVQISNSTEERVEDENRNPSAIRRNDEFKKRRRPSVLTQSPNFSSDDETLNPHYNAQTPIPNSPEYIEPELIPKEDPNPIEHVQNIISTRTINERNHSEEFRRSKNDFDKYDKFKSSVKSQSHESTHLRHQIISSERYEDDYRSQRKSSRELDNQYGNARFDRGGRGRRFSRSKYRDETKPRYSKSRTRERKEKFDRYQRSHSRSPSGVLGNREGRRLSRYSREMMSREIQKSSMSPNRGRERSFEKHWKDDREPRWKRSYERSRNNSREDHDGLSLRRKTEYACESTQLEDTKLEWNKEEAFSKMLNQNSDIDIHRKGEQVTNSLHGTQTDHKNYNNEQAHEPNLPMWQANRVLWELNKGRCRSDSFSQLDRQSSRDRSVNSRVCQSPDEMDGGYKPAPIEAVVMIPGRGPLTVYDDPRLYHERYFQNEEIGKHKASRLYNVKELDILNLRNRRNVNWKPTRFEHTIQHDGRQNHNLLQENTNPHQILRTQEPIRQEKFTIDPQNRLQNHQHQQTIRQERLTRDFQHQLQQHQQQEQQAHKISDEDKTQIYEDISGRCSRASLESGEIEDFIEKSNGKVEPKLSTEIKTNMDAINPETLESTIKKENVRHSAQLPSNDPILPLNKKSKRNKIPKIKKSKDGSKTRKDSEYKNSNINFKNNMMSQLDVRNVDTFGNCELENGMSLDHTLSTHETGRQEKFTRDQHQLQQHQQQEQQDNKKTKFYDKEKTRIYSDISKRCSQASLESGEIEDLLNLTEKVEKTNGKVEPQLSTEMETCTDAMNPETFEPSVNTENVSHAVKLPSINDPTLPLKNKSKAYKIPKINNSFKHSSKTRDSSENENSNTNLKYNFTSPLELNDLDKFGNIELEKDIQQNQHQKQQDHKKTHLCDEDTTKIYPDISKSGKIGDSLNLTDKLKKTDGIVEPQPSIEMKTCMDAINPETLEPTGKQENFRNTAKLPSINDPILSLKKKSKGYKIPKINNSKNSAKTRKESENKNINNLNSNMTSLLDVNNVNKVENCELVKVMALGNSIQACHNEEEFNTKPEDDILNLIKLMRTNVEELLKNSKNENELEVEFKTRENPVKEGCKSTESTRNKKYEDKLKPIKHKEKEISKGTSEDHSKEYSKEQKLKTISVSQQQSDENVELVHFHDYDEMTLKIGQHSESAGLPIETASVSSDHSRKLSSDKTEIKMDIDLEDIKLSLHKQKELQRDENPELVNFHDYDEKTSKISHHSERVGLSAETNFVSIDPSKELSNDMTKSKKNVDTEDMKLSDLRKQKELDNGKSKNLEHNNSKQPKREHRSRRKSKTGSVPNVNISPPKLRNDSVSTPVHVPTVSKSKSTIKTKDSKQVNKATEQIRVSEMHLEMVKTEYKVESNKNNSKKGIKIERNKFRYTSKTDDDIKRAQIEQNIKNKTNEGNSEKNIELFGESSLITLEDLQVAPVQSVPSSGIHAEMEFELSESFDERIKTSPSILCKIDKSKISGDLRKSDPSKTMITMEKVSTHKTISEPMLNEKLSKDNKKKRNETKKEATSLSLEQVENNFSRLVDIKGEEGSKNNPIQRNNCIPFEKPSNEIQQQEKRSLGTESITTEHLVKHNHNTPKPQDSAPAENSYNNRASNVNLTSRDMPSITDLIDNEKYRQSDCIHSENQENLPDYSKNILLKLSNKNSDSEPHTDSDCERPLFMTSTPNPKVSLQPYQKAICVHSPIKETSTPEISEQTNRVTEPNDTSRVQVNVSQSVPNTPIPQAFSAPIGAPTQVLFIRRKRRVIVRET